jgi:hypothetical protein
LHKGKDPKGSIDALICGLTYYIADLIREIKYNQVLQFYKQDPRERFGNAIESHSIEEETVIVAASAAAGDETTWRWLDEEHHDRSADRPAIWLTGQEVEETAAHTTPQRGEVSSTKDNHGAGSL